MLDVQIFLVTYNRKNKLKSTLDSLLKSPVANNAITILDNASTDGTSELLDKYASKYKNIKHIRHKINIGGNANICRAFEMAASCGKKYAWVLCDDDKYDFSNWGEVEIAIQSGADLICVSDYIFPDKNSKSGKAYQMFQMTFVPATIFKTSLITNSVLMNMYDSIYTMFQQTCLTAHVINNGGAIVVLNKPIVFNGFRCEEGTSLEDVSYIRGTDDKTEVLSRRKDTSWILGYCNVLSLLNDKNLQKECMRAAIPYKDIYKSWEDFHDNIYHNYFYSKFNYFYEIIKMLPPKQKKCLILYTMNHLLIDTIKFIFSIDHGHIMIFGIKFYRKRK